MCASSASTAAAAAAAFASSGCRRAGPKLGASCYEQDEERQDAHSVRPCGHVPVHNELLQIEQRDRVLQAEEVNAGGEFSRYSTGCGLIYLQGWVCGCVWVSRYKPNDCPHARPS